MAVGGNLTPTSLIVSPFRKAFHQSRWVTDEARNTKHMRFVQMSSIRLTDPLLTDLISRLAFTNQILQTLNNRRNSIK
jgi:hypothetical protein